MEDKPTKKSLETRLNGMSDEDIESSWRASIVRSLESITKVQNDTALLVERLTGRMQSAEDNIKELKAAPATGRDILSTSLQAGGCLGSVFFGFLSTVSLALSIIVIIMHH